MARPVRSPFAMAGYVLRRSLRAVAAHPGLLAWAAAAPLAGLAAARAVRYEGHPLVAVANAATPFAYLPAWGALAVGVLGRRPALTAVAGAVTGAHLAWTAPELRPAREDAAPPPGIGRRTLRLFCANIRFTAPDWMELAGEIAAFDADVVFLQELTPTSLVVLRRAGAFSAYTDELVDPRPRSFGSGIWSRLPMSEAEPWSIDGHPMMRAVVSVGGTRVRLVNVHTRSPLIGGLARWHHQLAALAEVAAQESGPLLMAGDFNATRGNPGFRSILRAGMSDAHVEVGRGLVTTWPRGRALPTLFRLDHVLVSEGLTVLDAGVGTGGASDHRPVWVEAAVRG